MGLFSRLKQAFSQPESTEPSQAAAAESSATSTVASQAEAVTSAPASATSSVAAVSDVAATTTSTAVTPVSPSSAASETAAVTSSVTAMSQVSESVATSAEAEPVSHEMTATESMAARIKSAQASVASATASLAGTQAHDVVASSAAVTPVTSDAPRASSEAAVSPVSNVEPAMSAATVVDSEAATTSAEPTEAQRYDEGLKKSRKTFGDRINAFLANFRHVDEDFFDDLEDTLIESDVGYETAMQISEDLRDEVKLKNAKSKKEISSVIVEKLVDMYGEAGEGEDNSIHLAESGPTVILFVGVNGAGKTTTIGKMANMYKQQGKKVLLAACDTFRAGAIQQLQVWGQRDGVDVVAGAERSDPASVCFDAVKKAKAEDYDILFVDTAGRLQNKVNLMNELEKIKRVITREIPAAPQEVLLVLDATTGQNALNQAKLFKQSTAVTGIVLTKLDGTARGGIVLAIRNELHLAVKYVGLGEKVTDLRPFNANDFVYGLFKDVITG